MNYLAHIYLSHHRPDILMGNFLGDMIANKDYALLPEGIRRGVDLHRRIDTYTDGHPRVLEAVGLLRPEHGKYAPVVVDILYDYFLSRHWGRYSEWSIRDVAEESYRIIRSGMDYVPMRRKKQVELMLEHDWLVGYGEPEQLYRMFLRVKQRARFPNAFEKATEHLRIHHDALEEGFLLFFPDLDGWTKDAV